MKAVNGRETEPPDWFTFSVFPAQVVPLALVGLLTGCSIKEVESHLEKAAVVREAVEMCLAKSVP